MQALNYLVHYKNYSVDNSHKTDQNAQCCLASEDCLKFSIIHLVKNFWHWSGYSLSLQLG